MDPINAHVLELLNIALEQTATLPKSGGVGFKQTMQKLQSKYSGSADITGGTQLGPISTDVADGPGTEDDMNVSQRT